jgi:hypothetical protein
VRNLARLTNAANRIEARRDWNALADKAKAAGLDADVNRLQPPPTAGWRTIDKRIARLRERLQEATS